MQEKMKSPTKKRASLRQYTPQNQLSLDCFNSPFGNLDSSNRWVQLSDSIPWDSIVNLYHKHHPPKPTGRPPVNPRILIGAVIIKHLNDYDDRETIQQIRENIYLQYFLGFEGFTTESPFDASLFVDIRKKLTADLLQSISERLLGITKESLLPSHSDLQQEDNRSKDDQEDNISDQDSNRGPITHKGVLLMDATVAPQAIAYPTDLNLLNDGREMSEKIIDFLYLYYKQQSRETEERMIFLSKPNTIVVGTLESVKENYEQLINTFSLLSKPRTYRQKARADYLKTAQSKRPSRKQIRLAIGKQLRYLRRNIRHIEKLLDLSDTLVLEFPLPEDLQRYYWIIQLLYDQQLEMFEQKKHIVNNRLVSIHQPHVRPIKRGKAQAKTEFGAKIHLSMIEGYSFIDTISWDAFNEGTHLKEYVQEYKNRYGYYPEKVLVDKIYSTRANRKWLKKEGIKISAKPLGRPSAKAVAYHISPGERNPIEGKFGQAKTAYGLNRIRARLAQTSQSWIASIVLVLNLVKWAGSASYGLNFEGFSNGARWFWCETLGFINQIKAICDIEIKFGIKQYCFGRFCNAR